ncbi:ATP-binding protein [Arthrobacter sp. JSM 101049]|uniref:ATP-binding protein n=1 Tax=Arthrobacter sp. JSM 101049 TaxID=929097 RepID=UPI0035640C9A
MTDPTHASVPDGTAGARGTVPAPVAELRSALEILDALITVRLEERRGGPTDRPLSLDDDGGALPDVRRFAGTGPLATLIASTGLTSAEAITLVAALAPAIDERFAVRYGALTDRPGVTGFTGEVARNLVGRSFADRLDATLMLAPQGLLRTSGLLELDPPGDLAGRLHPGADLTAWLLGLPPVPPTATADFPARPLTTVHTLDDVVLPAGARRRVTALAGRIAQRSTVVDDWGFGTHHDNASGLLALFHGPPGTGKTMTAAALAASAGLPAYVIDLSALVSKYIGETEKALARVFDRAARDGSILVFDEADAVFGARTEIGDAHDRYANQEVSYLLTRIEEHPGIVVLTSNILANIDAAFQRRIHVMIEFPEPGPGERQRLWSSVAPPELPLDPDIDRAALAQRYRLTGAQIRDATLDAAYLAAADGRVVTTEHLLEGIRRQYEKTARTVPE